MEKRTTVDTDIDSADAGWEFDATVAESFDSHVRKSIPNYDAIQAQTVKLTDWFVQTNYPATIYDIGCATGETLERLVEHYRGTETRFVGIDIEEPMLAKARDRHAVNADVQLRQADLTQDPRFPDATVVVSLFTLSFIPEADRAALLARIYDDLPRGGAFVFCEKTRADAALFQDIYTEHYWDFKLQQGLDETQVIGKAKTLRGQLRPLTVDEYRAMLTDAGFAPENIGLWYKWYPWAGMVARK